LAQRRGKIENLRKQSGRRIPVRRLGVIPVAISCQTPTTKKKREDLYAPSAMRRASGRKTGRLTLEAFQQFVRQKTVISR